MRTGATCTPCGCTFALFGGREREIERWKVFCEWRVESIEKDLKKFSSPLFFFFSSPLRLDQNDRRVDRDSLRRDGGADSS